MTTQTRRSAVGGRRLRLAIAAALTLVAVGSTTVQAHEVAADQPSNGDPLSLAAVVVAVVSVGILGGLAVILTGTSLRARHHTLFDRCLGGLLVILGVTLGLSAVAEYPTVAVAGLVGGGFLTRSLTTHAEHNHHAELALGTLVTHRTIEGVALVALYQSGSTIGLAGALVVAGHATLETAVVGGLYSERGRPIAALTIGVLQAGFVGGAVAGALLAIVLPLHLSVAVVAIGAGALLVVGNITFSGQHTPA